MAECSILEGSFAWVLQALLAIAALLVLLYKRSKDQRPWLVFFFDTSKQAVAAFLQHSVNLAVGVTFARNSSASQCAWYFVNFSISVFAGLFLIHLFMRAYTVTVNKCHLTLLRSGEYGKPPSYKPWLAQLLVWGFIAVAEKATVASVLILPLHGRLDAIASKLEEPLKGYPQLELVWVMIIAPGILNAFFFYVVDSILMGPSAPRSRAVSEESQPLLEGGCGSCCPTVRHKPSSAYTRCV